MTFHGRYFSEEEKEVIMRTAHQLREQRELFSEITNISFHLEGMIAKYILSFKDDIVGMISFTDVTLNNLLQKLEYLYSFETNMFDDVDFSSRLSYLKTFTAFHTADILEVMGLSFNDFQRLNTI